MWPKKDSTDEDDDTPLDETQIANIQVKLLSELTLVGCLPSGKAPDQYRPPEIVGTAPSQWGDYSQKKADIWVVVVTIYELITGKEVRHFKNYCQALRRGELAEMVEATFPGLGQYVHPNPTKRSDDVGNLRQIVYTMQIDAN
jgi:hypothetical protein